MSLLSDVICRNARSFSHHSQIQTAKHDCSSTPLMTQGTPGLWYDCNTMWLARIQCCSLCLAAQRKGLYCSMQVSCLPVVQGEASEAVGIGRGELAGA